MAYTPIGWVTGDTITADKLNKMDNGWGVESSSETVMDGSVTTEYDYGDNYAILTLTGNLPITTGSVAIITFNGTAYNCTCFVDGGAPTYGGAYEDYSQYPFRISYFELEQEWSLYTETAGTYTIKIEAVSGTVEVSDDFQTAISSFVDYSAIPMRVIPDTTTSAEVASAISNNRLMYFVDNGQYYFVSLAPTDGTAWTLYPTQSVFTLQILNGVVTIGY